MMGTLYRAVWSVLCALFVVLPMVGSEASEGGNLARDELVSALQTGGYVIYFRHTATDHDQVDSDHIDMADCTTQRNLSAEGRHQAHDIGEAFKSLGIPVGAVITSPYCRAKDMGRLAFGSATASDNLRFTIRDDDTETGRRAAALRKMLSTAPPQGRNTVIVAHTANLKEATGIWPKPEGLAAIFRPLPGGRFEHVASVMPEEWADLAGRL